MFNYFSGLWHATLVRGIAYKVCPCFLPVRSAWNIINSRWKRWKAEFRRTCAPDTDGSHKCGGPSSASNGGNITVTSVPTNGSEWPVYFLCALFAESRCFLNTVSLCWRRWFCRSLTDAYLLFRPLKLVFIFTQLTWITWNRHKYMHLCFSTAMLQLSGAGKEGWRKVWESQCGGFLCWHLRPWMRCLGKGAE